MVYRRPNRPSLYFEAKTRTGFKQLCAWTPDKLLAQQIEHMWNMLATRYRAWDLLDPVLVRPRTIGALYDAWVETRQDVEAMRRRAADVDLDPLVAEWFGVYKKGVEPDTAKHALAHVRWLLPAGVPLLSSAVNADWLTAKLTAYPAKRRNTTRKVHSSWSGFFDYLVLPKKVYAASPMLHVARPSVQRALVAFYDAGTVQRIVEWQPDAVRRAFFALVYGSGADVSAALVIERTDVNAATKEVRIQGTKTGSRDRLVRIADALWPAFWSHAKTVLSGRVFPAEWSRFLVSDWHRQTVGVGNMSAPRWEIAQREGLKLAKRLPLRKARHHFAVRLLQAGAPVRVVAEQLGSDERTVLLHYGPWITSSEDRARAEQMASEHETKRRDAK